MATDLEDRQKLLLSDGTKYIELEVDSESAVKLKSDLQYAKRHMMAIEQMLPASVKQHQDGDDLDKLDYFILVNPDRGQASQLITDDADEDMVSVDNFTWNSKSATLLCKLRLEMNQMFHGGPRNMKMSLWNKCAKTMRQHGYLNANGESCRKKWYNMMMTYKRVLDNPGSSNWEFFNLVHAVMQQQATSDPSPALVISTLSEPRKRRRTTVRHDTETFDDVTQNGDLFEMPSMSNYSDQRSENTTFKEHRSKSRDSDSILKMILKLRHEELEFQKQESERKWDEKRQRRRDRLKFQEEKIKAIQAFTETLKKVVDK